MPRYRSMYPILHRINFESLSVAQRKCPISVYFFGLPNWGTTDSTMGKIADERIIKNNFWMPLYGWCTNINNLVRILLSAQSKMPFLTKVCQNWKRWCSVTGALYARAEFYDIRTHPRAFFRKCRTFPWNFSSSLQYFRNIVFENSNGLVYNWFFTVITLTIISCRVPFKSICHL